MTNLPFISEYKQRLQHLSQPSTTTERQLTYEKKRQQIPSGTAEKYIFFWRATALFVLLLGTKRLNPIVTDWMIQNNKGTDYVPCLSDCNLLPTNYTCFGVRVHDITFFFGWWQHIKYSKLTGWICVCVKWKEWCCVLRKLRMWTM